MLETAGFEIIPQVLSSAECDAISTHATEVLLNGAGSRRLLEAPWCRHLANTLRTHQEIKPRLPENALAVQCTLFDKSPEKNWLVPLHQDLTIPVREKTNSPNCSGWSEKEGVVFVQPPFEFLARLLAIRIHLDDSRENNGPLKVVPGSHLYGRLSTADAETQREQAGDFICTAHRGDALLIRPLLLHASSKAQSHAPRRVLHFLFGPPKLPCGLQWHHTI
jgi:ectoine hydroxylase-related dioxygenase (phytanoyl-CoA dioxygenase family)